MSSRIKKCLIGRKYTEETEELNSLGIETFLLPESLKLDDEINNHADILCFNAGNGELFIDSSIAGEIEPFLKGYKVAYCELIESPYPNDIKLNVALMGSKLFCNVKAVNDELLLWAKRKNISLIHTNQGYTKCNMCVVNDSAVITEDDGLSSLLKNYQTDVLKVVPGSVTLSDSHYGFIGGAGVKISDNEMYFSGDISSHPEYAQISSFLNKYNVTPIFNPNRPLRDFGGLIAL